MRLLPRQPDPARTELEEIKRVLLELKHSAPRTRCTVGAGVCLANAEFLRRFGGAERFRQISTGDREDFYTKLGELELSLRAEEPRMALGVGLYRIWLAEMLSGKSGPAELLGEELAELSRSASGSGAAEVR